MFTKWSIVFLSLFVFTTNLLAEGDKGTLGATSVDGSSAKVVEVVSEKEQDEKLTNWVKEVKPAAGNYWKAKVVGRNRRTITK